MNKSERIDKTINDDFTKALHTMYSDNETDKNQLCIYALSYFYFHHDYRFAYYFSQYRLHWQHYLNQFYSFNRRAKMWLKKRHKPGRAMYWEQKAQARLEIAPVKHGLIYRRRGSHEPMHMKHQDPYGIKLTPNDWKMIYQLIENNDSKSNNDY